MGLSSPDIAAVSSVGKGVSSSESRELEGRSRSREREGKQTTRESEEGLTIGDPLMAQLA